MSGHHRWADTRDNRRFRDATGVERHLGFWCGCPLLDCCHNEGTDLAGSCCTSGRHVESGNPATGYLYPWEPGDESWRDSAQIPPGIAKNPGQPPEGS